MSYANTKLDKTRQGYLEAKAAGKPVSTSRRAYLTEIQDTIFMAIPEENLARVPLSEQVLNDPEFYANAMHSAAAISEDELFMALFSSLKDMTVQEAREFTSTLWHGTIDENAREYAEALKRPEREIMPLRLSIKTEFFNKIRPF
jgi:DNA repair protein RadC